MFNLRIKNRNYANSSCWVSMFNHAHFKISLANPCLYVKTLRCKFLIIFKYLYKTNIIMWRFAKVVIIIYVNNIYFASI